MDGDPAAAAAEERAGERGAHTGQQASEDPPGSSAEDAAPGVGILCCQDCGEAFREEAAYMEHRRQHLQENMYLDKAGETANFCTLCSLSFTELSEFRSHMEKTHGHSSRKNSSIQQQSYECPDCGKCYSMIGHLLNHQRSHRQASKSVFHDLEHLKKKSFQCESCGRSYSRASALDAHRRCHEEKLVKSRNRSLGELCHTEESVAEAKPHEEQTDTTPEKPYECSCGKSFTALMRLKTHQRFSRNSQCAPEQIIEKPKKNTNEFNCSECNKSFSGHIAFFNHQRWHANHSDDSAKRFPCEECGKVFMTLTFYYRHQRTAHSVETPAKSFLHQVCQLQKKAFECKDCGLKFSRASALQSHQLHHTNVYGETEKERQVLPQNKTLESESTQTEQEKVEFESFLPEENVDEDAESYELGDFDVKVISGSESEDEHVQDQNPDLELLCESDQEARDDGDDDMETPGTSISKPEMDLKIVQIDFEQADTQSPPIMNEEENKKTEERFDCPECYRWFSSHASLRIHRMWHGVHKRRREAQGQSEEVYTCDTPDVVAHEQQEGENTSRDTLSQPEGLDKKILTCSECGKSFSRLSALVCHQMHHPKRKRFQCPDCMMSYVHAASLFNHIKNCSAQKRESLSVTKEYNPKKTLLGPKIYHCEQCGKGFWSLGAYSHHKQSQTQCADLMLKKGLKGSFHSVNGHSRSSVKVACPVCGRKFRHKGIMALHMRKHENGNHKCELCNRSFRLFSSLLRHQVVHSEQLLPPPIKSFQHQVEQLKKNTYSCPDCGKLFSRAKALQFHMKSHGYETGHSPSSPGSAVTLEDLQCPTCLAHFNSKLSLRAHQKLCGKRDTQAVCKPESSENNNNNNNNITEKSCQDSKHLKVEVSEEDSVELKLENQRLSKLENPCTTDLKYKCTKCDRSFSVVGALNFHKRIHDEGSKPVAKGKSSMSIILKKKAKQEEAGKGPFHCSECGRRFTSNSALGSHRRWHKEKTFSRSLLKDNSQSGSHKAESGPFQCHKCGKQFFNLGVLQRHQIFNPQCDIKAEPEGDSGKNVESKDSPSQEVSYLHSNNSSPLAALSENKHINTEEEAKNEGEGLPLNDTISEKIDVKLEKVSMTLKPKAHECPLCSMTFAKARGLRAHKWQAHSKKMKGKNRLPSGIKRESVNSIGVAKMSESSPGDWVTAEMIGKRKKESKCDPMPVASVSCLDCGTQVRSVSALLDHKKVCTGLKSKQEIQTPETTADVSPTFSHPSEQTVKCLFKCDKCGKAFQTEEQLGAHKAKAKSRPYCCALCCHGLWSENQLHQHLVWHDEIRCRLPNEVRFRLSSAMTSKPPKPQNPPASSSEKPLPVSVTQPKPTADSYSQSHHKCQHCGKAFLSPAALQKHETQHCNNDSYHCSICPRTFSEIQDLIDHHQDCICDFTKPE